MDANAPRVLGELALGPLVIGEARYNALQAKAAATSQGVLGPLVVDAEESAPEPPESVPVIAAEQTEEALSVASVKRELADSPLHVDRLMGLELARPDPRIGALEALLAAEARREDGPRETVVLQLQAALQARREEG